MADQAIATPWMRTTLIKPKLSADAERELLKSVTISRALTSKTHLIRLPVHAQAPLYQITKAMKRLSEKLPGSPTDEGLA